MNISLSHFFEVGLLERKNQQYQTPNFVMALPRGTRTPVFAVRGGQPVHQRTTANDRRWPSIAPHLTIFDRACSAPFGPVYWRKVGESQPCRDQPATPNWRPEQDERA